MMNEDLEKQIKMKILEQLMGDMDEESYSKVSGKMGDGSGIQDSLPEDLKAKVPEVGGQEMEENAMPDEDNVADVSPEAMDSGASVPANISKGEGNEDADYMGSRIMQKIKERKKMMMGG